HSRPPKSTLFPYTTLFRSSQAFGSRLTIGRLGIVSSDTQVLPFAVQLVQTSEPRISAPAWPLSVTGLRTVTLSRYTHAGTLSVRSEEHTSELQSLRHLVCR